jgi:hypothetical protein
MFDKEFRRLTERQVDALLSAVTTEIHRQALRNASVTNSGETIKITRPRKGGNKTQRTIYPDSSRPGESPRRRTGFGRENIVMGYSKQRKEGRVGYTRNARYMTFHELGIRYKKMGFQQRPTIVPVLRDNPQQLVAVGRAAMRAVQ